MFFDMRQAHSRHYDVAQYTSMARRRDHNACALRVLEIRICVSVIRGNKDTHLNNKDTRLSNKDTRLSNKDTRLSNKDTRLRNKDKPNLAKSERTEKWS